MIEKGVAEGDTVVTDGQLRLFPGAHVRAGGRARSFGLGAVVNLSRLFIERPDHDDAGVRSRSCCSASLRSARCRSPHCRVSIIRPFR